VEPYQNIPVIHRRRINSHHRSAPGAMSRGFDKQNIPWPVSYNPYPTENDVWWPNVEISVDPHHAQHPGFAPDASSFPETSTNAVEKEEMHVTTCPASTISSTCNYSVGSWFEMHPPPSESDGAYRGRYSASQPGTQTAQQDKCEMRTTNMDYVSDWEYHTSLLVDPSSSTSAPHWLDGIATENNSDSSDDEEGSHIDSAMASRKHVQLYSSSHSHTHTSFEAHVAAAACFEREPGSRYMMMQDMEQERSTLDAKGMKKLTATALVPRQDMRIRAHATFENSCEKEAVDMCTEAGKNARRQHCDKAEKRCLDHQNSSLWHHYNRVRLREKAKRKQEEHDDDDEEDDDDDAREPVTLASTSSPHDRHRNTAQTQSLAVTNIYKAARVKKSNRMSHIKKKRQTSAQERRINRPEHNHSPHAKAILRAWFYGNLHAPGGPYPTDQVKDNLALQTGLTRIQISNFYINERKRFPEWRRSAAYVSPRSERD
jgi:hypothetical protein